MEHIYFSKDNYTRICQILTLSFKQKYNISLRKKLKSGYKKQLIDIMKYVYSNRASYNIPANLKNDDKSRYLTQKLIKLLLLYESKNHPEKNPAVEPVTIVNMPTESNLTDVRPKVTFNTEENQSMQDKLNLLIEKRKPHVVNREEINFTETNDEQIDISRRYKEMSETREFDYETSRLNMDTPNELSQPNEDFHQQLNMTPDNVDMDDVMLNFQSVESTPSIENAIDVDYTADKTNLDIKPFNSTEMLFDSVDSIGTRFGAKGPKGKRRRFKKSTGQKIIQARGGSRLSGEKTIHTLILNLSESNNTRTIAFAQENQVPLPGRANLDTEFKNVISFKLNRLIVPENLIFGERAIAQNSIVGIEHKLDDINDFEIISDELSKKLYGEYSNLSDSILNISGGFPFNVNNDKIAFYNGLHNKVAALGNFLSTKSSEVDSAKTANLLNTLPSSVMVNISGAVDLSSVTYTIPVAKERLSEVAQERAKHTLTNTNIYDDFNDISRQITNLTNLKQNISDNSTIYKDRMDIVADLLVSTSSSSYDQAVLDDLAKTSALGNRWTEAIALGASTSLNLNDSDATNFSGSITTESLESEYQGAIYNQGKSVSLYNSLADDVRESTYQLRDISGIQAELATFKTSNLATDIIAALLIQNSTDRYNTAAQNAMNASGHTTALATSSANTFPTFSGGDTQFSLNETLIKKHMDFNSAKNLYENHLNNVVVLENSYNDASGLYYKLQSLDISGELTKSQHMEESLLLEGITLDATVTQNKFTNAETNLNSIWTSISGFTEVNSQTHANTITTPTTLSLPALTADLQSSIYARDSVEYSKNYLTTLTSELTTKRNNASGALLKVKDISTALVKDVDLVASLLISEVSSDLTKSSADTTSTQAILAANKLELYIPKLIPLLATNTYTLKDIDVATVSTFVSKATLLTPPTLLKNNLDMAGNMAKVTACADKITALKTAADAVSAYNTPSWADMPNTIFKTLSAVGTATNASNMLGLLGESESTNYTDPIIHTKLHATSISGGLSFSEQKTMYSLLGNTVNTLTNTNINAINTWVGALGGTVLDSPGQLVGVYKEALQSLQNTKDAISTHNYPTWASELPTGIFTDLMVNNDANTARTIYNLSGESLTSITAANALSTIKTALYAAAIFGGKTEAEQKALYKILDEPDVVLGVSGISDISGWITALPDKLDYPGSLVDRYQTALVNLVNAKTAVTAHDFSISVPPTVVDTEFTTKSADLHGLVGEKFTTLRSNNDHMHILNTLSVGNNTAYTSLAKQLALYDLLDNETAKITSIADFSTWISATVNNSDLKTAYVDAVANLTAVSTDLSTTVANIVPTSGISTSATYSEIITAIANASGGELSGLIGENRESINAKNITTNIIQKMYAFKSIPNINASTRKELFTILGDDSHVLTGNNLSHISTFVNKCASGGVTTTLSNLSNAKTAINSIFDKKTLLDRLTGDGSALSSAEALDISNWVLNMPANIFTELDNYRTKLTNLITKKTTLLSKLSDAEELAYTAIYTADDMSNTSMCLATKTRVSLEDEKSDANIIAALNSATPGWGSSEYASVSSELQAKNTLFTNLSGGRIITNTELTDLSSWFPKLPTRYSNDIAGYNSAITDLVAKKTTLASALSSESASTGTITYTEANLPATIFSLSGTSLASMTTGMGTDAIVASLNALSTTVPNFGDSENASSLSELQAKNTLFTNLSGGRIITNTELTELSTWFPKLPTRYANDIVGYNSAVTDLAAKKTTLTVALSSESASTITYEEVALPATIFSLSGTLRAELVTGGTTDAIVTALNTLGSAATNLGSSENASSSTELQAKNALFKNLSSGRIITNTELTDLSTWFPKLPTRYANDIEGYNSALTDLSAKRTVLSGVLSSTEASTWETNLPAAIFSLSGTLRTELATGGSTNEIVTALNTLGTTATNLGSSENASSSTELQAKSTLFTSLSSGRIITNAELTDLSTWFTNLPSRYNSDIEDYTLAITDLSTKKGVLSAALSAESASTGTIDYGEANLPATIFSLHGTDRVDLVTGGTPNEIVTALDALSTTVANWGSAENASTTTELQAKNTLFTNLSGGRIITNPELNDLSTWLSILPVRYANDISGYTKAITDLVSKKANLLSQLTTAEKTSYGEANVPANLFSLDLINRDSLVTGGTDSAIIGALNNASGGWGTSQSTATNPIIPAISAWWTAKLALYDSVKAINITTAAGTVIPAISAWWTAKLALYDSVKTINITTAAGTIIPAINAWWTAKLALYDSVKAINITTAPGTIIPSISSWWMAKLALYDSVKAINITTAAGTIIPAISSWWVAKRTLYNSISAISITTSPSTIIPSISNWWAAKLALYDALKAINISDYISRILCPGESSCQSSGTINTLENESYATLTGANTEDSTKMRLNTISAGWGDATNTTTLELIGAINKWSDRRLELLTSVQSLKSFLWVAQAEHEFTSTPTTGLISDIMRWTGARVRLYDSLNPLKNLLWLAVESLKFNSGNNDNIIVKIKTLTQSREELYTSLLNLKGLLWAVAEEQVYATGNSKNVLTKFKNWTQARVTHYNSMINLREVLWLSAEYSTNNTTLVSNSFFNKVKAWVDAKAAIFSTIAPMLGVSPQATIQGSDISGFSRDDLVNLHTNSIIELNSLSSLLSNKHNWDTNTLLGVYTEFIANQETILNWSKSMLDYFDALEKKTYFTTKLANLNTVYTTLETTTTAFQVAQVQFKILENNYSSSVTELASHTALLMTKTAALTRMDGVVNWRNARVDSFKALNNRDETAAKKAKFTTSLQTFKVLDIETYNQGFVSAKSAFDLASAKTTGLSSNVEAAHESVTWSRAVLDLYNTTKTASELKTQRDNLEAIVNLNGGRQGASIEMQSIITKSKKETAIVKLDLLKTALSTALADMNLQNGIVDWRKSRLDSFNATKLKSILGNKFADISGANSSKKSAPKSVELEIATVKLSNAVTESGTLAIKLAASNKISNGLALLEQYASTVVDYLEALTTKESVGQDIKYLKTLHDLEINEKQSKYTTDLTDAQSAFVTLKATCNASAEPFLLITSEDLFGLDGAANIHSNGGFPKNIIARVYPDKTIMGKTHFINSDNASLKFRNAITLPSPLHFKIQRYNSGSTGSVISQECQIIIEIETIE